MANTVAPGDSAPTAHAPVDPPSDATTVSRPAPRRRRLYDAPTPPAGSENLPAGDGTPPATVDTHAQPARPRPSAEPAAAHQPVAPPPSAVAEALTDASATRASACHRSPLLRRLKGRQAIRDHALLAAGAMAIPVPLLDMATEAAIQVRMLKRLAHIHGVDFAEERAKALVAAAIGGFSTGWAAGSLLRYASFASYFTALWPSALLSSAITYGIGRLFEQHFERGGTFHDLSPDAAAQTLRDTARRLRRSRSAARTAP